MTVPGACVDDSKMDVMTCLFYSESTEGGSLLRSRQPGSEITERFRSVELIEGAGSFERL